MNEEFRLSNPRLFARWAGEDLESWQQAVGVSVTHLSRGDGRVTKILQDAGVISIHVQYAQADHQHPTWEFRTEFTNMTLPEGLSRDEVIPAVKARRLAQEQEEKTTRHIASLKGGHRGDDNLL